MPFKSQILVRDIASYLESWLPHTATLLTGGAVIALIGIWEHRQGRSVDWQQYVSLILALLIMAGFLAWRDERREVESLKAKLPLLEIDVHEAYAIAEVSGTFVALRAEIRNRANDAETILSHCHLTLNIKGKKFTSEALNNTTGFILGIIGDIDEEDPETVHIKERQAIKGLTFPTATPVKPGFPISGWLCFQFGRLPWPTREISFGTRVDFDPEGEEIEVEDIEHRIVIKKALDYFSILIIDGHNQQHSRRGNLLGVWNHVLEHS